MFNEYPYVNLQDVNLDWILKHIKDLETNLQDFVKLNTIKYADPIIWNITKQYETNTVVIDGNTGTAYLSVQPVPAGVALTNTDYWTVIFTLNLTTSNQNITFRDDGTNVVATFASDTGDWLLWNFYLYRVTQPISINTAYVEGFNIERFSVELFIKDYISTLSAAINTIIGDLDNLTTSDKTSVVNAINSALSDLTAMIGDLDDLDTSDKTSVVNAINSALSDLTDTIGNLDDLDTSDKTSVVNAINEALAEAENKLVIYPEMFGAVGDGITSDAQAFKDCFAAAEGKAVLLTKTYLIDDTLIYIPDDCTVIGAGGVVLDSAHTQDDNVRTGIFCIYNKHNVKIQNITFKGVTLGEQKTSSYFTNTLIDIADSTDVEIVNNRFLAIDSNNGIIIKHCTSTKVKDNYITWYRYTAIGTLNNSRNVEISNNIIYNCGFDYVNTYAIGISSVEHSGAVENQVTCSNVICDGNLIFCETDNNEWEGIDAHGGDKLTVTNNSLYNIRYGIALFSEIGRNFAVNDSFISSNTLIYEDGNNPSFNTYGISIGGDRNVVTNNYIYGYGRGGNVGGAIYILQWLRYSKIAYNTIVAFYNGAIAYGAYNDTNMSRDLDISNNTFMAGQTGAYIWNTENAAYPNVAFSLEIVFRNNTYLRSGGVQPAFNLPTAYSEAMVLENNAWFTVPTFNNNLRNVAPDLINLSDINSFTSGGRVGHVVTVAGGGAGDPVLMIWNGSAYRKINASA